MRMKIFEKDCLLEDLFSLNSHEEIVNLIPLDGEDYRLDISNSKITINVETKPLKFIVTIGENN